MLPLCLIWLGLSFMPFYKKVWIEDRGRRRRRQGRREGEEIESGAVL
jgi:hypothetical protein